jgi:hypothetical protein
MPLDDDVLRVLQSDPSREWRPKDVHQSFAGKTLVQIQYALKKLVEAGSISKRTVGRGVLYRVLEESRLPVGMQACPACSGRGTIPVDQLPAERAKRRAASDILRASREGPGDAEVDPAELVPLEDGRVLFCCARGHQMVAPAAAV